jgi:D-sedoheptulose 7-phosphate isomerase
MTARTKRPVSGPLEREVRAALRESALTLAQVQKDCAPAVAAAAELLLGCFENGGTVYFCGNGGSAADAQHLAAEFSGRYLVDRPGLPAVALTANSSAVTAIGNDYGYDQVFSRQLEGMGEPGDVLVAITTSGRSESVRNAVREAQRLGMTVIGMTGAGRRRLRRAVRRRAHLADAPHAQHPGRPHRDGARVLPDRRALAVPAGQARCGPAAGQAPRAGAQPRAPCEACTGSPRAPRPEACMIVALLQALRPKQWTKNLLVFAGVVFAQLAGEPGMLLRAAAGFLAFSLLAGTVYLVNDLKDVDADRQHPKKKKRPVASGRLKPAVAWAAVPVLLCSSACWPRGSARASRGCSSPTSSATWRTASG